MANAPFDIATEAFNGNSGEFNYWFGDNGSTPSTSDVFTYHVTYSDNSTGTLTASPTAILSAFASGLSPTWNTSNVSTTPKFTWTYPSGAASYTYQFQLWDSNGNTIWSIPNQNSNSNGFTSAQVSGSTGIAWGVDPTGGGSSPSVSSLSPNSVYTWEIQANDVDQNESSTQVSFMTAEAPLALPAAGSNPLGTALVGMPFSGTINASGGSGSYAFTVNGVSVPTNNTTVSIGLDGLSATNSGGNSLFITGTPTTTSAGLSVPVKVEDTNNTSDTVSVTYTLPVVAGPNGANNNHLSGTYVCKTDGFYDDSGARWAALASFKANGAAGTFTGGIFDTNSRKDSSAASGTVSGTYSIGSDNNGLLTLNVVLTSGGPGSQTIQWALALTNAATPAQEFRMVETDDVGSSPSGQNGSADCFLATTSAFGVSTPSGKGFAFGVQGENGNGIPKAYVGRFTASTESATGGTGGAAGGAITAGDLDGMRVDQSGDNGGAFTGSYTVPDSTTGRYTLTLIPTAGGGSAVFAAYVIDANRMFMLEIAGDTGLQAGDMRAQQQTSYSNSSLNAAAVLYSPAFQYNSGNGSSTYYSSIYRVTGNGAGTLTVNQSYDDQAGTYLEGKENGGSAAVTFDSAYPGRATFSPGSDSAFLYFFNTNDAFYLDLNGGQGWLEPGWLMAQSQATFTNAAVAGNYLLGSLPRLHADDYDAAGVLDLASNGNVTGGVTTAGEQYLAWDSSISDTYRGIPVPPPVQAPCSSEAAARG